MTAEISVIIPAYNAGMHIDKALKSVLEQDCNKEVEIIVVDDSSTDNTEDVVSEISRCHNQIRYIPNVRKKGPSGARNTGILKASGNYVAFLDADDLWLPNHLREGVSFLEKHDDIDVVLLNFNKVEYETGRLVSDWFSERSYPRGLKSQTLENGFQSICDDLFMALINESFVHLQSMIVRRKLLQSVFFNEDICRSEDRDFSIRLYLHEKARFAFNNKITGIYYRHKSSLTSNSMKNTLLVNLDQIKIFSGYLEEYKLDTEAVSRLNSLLYQKYLDASYCYRKLQCHGLAMTSLCRSFRYQIRLVQFTLLAKVAIAYVFCIISPQNREECPKL